MPRRRPVLTLLPAENLNYLKFIRVGWMGETEEPDGNPLRRLEIDVPRREVRADGLAVQIGGRAFDILLVLAEQSGAIVAKEALKRRVWPDAAVTDEALRLEIAAVRKALGERSALLKAVSGRGYRLLGHWSLQHAADDVEPAPLPLPTARQPSRPGPLDGAADAPDPQVAASFGQPTFRSGDCEIDLAQRQIRIRGMSIPIGSRAFDIMAALVQAANDVVTRDQLLDRVWPGVTVGESAIDVHISAIRKALGEHRGLLKTISGRGYRLVGTWVRQDSPGPTPTPPPMRFGRSTNLPEAATQLVGRRVSLEYLREAARAYRLVTCTGPGGIGKTALAIELARSLLPEFDGGVWLVELASLADPDLMPLAVAEAIGLQVSGVVSDEGVARAIGDDHLLLVLDNCEHLIGRAAQFAEIVLRIAPNAVILATSRETLQTYGECVYRVPPLDVPQHNTGAAAAILGSGSVQLFLERSEALQIANLRQGQNLRLIAAICRDLDGIPLAIEFAAARAASLGLSQVASSLKDRFALLTTGRRTALPRHRTLRAVLDWSYALLQEPERLLLHRLALFPGGFVFDAACAVMQDRSSSEVEDSLANLVEKSLVNLDHSTSAGRWRLLETVRAYALDKLTASGEFATIARRQAEFFQGLFATFDSYAGLESGSDELPRYVRELDNLRAALSWAFSAPGTAALGTALAAAAVNVWLAASLLDECSRWTSKALAELERDAHSEQEMVLRTGLGLSLMFAEGMISTTEANLSQALSIAESRGNTEYEKRAVFGLWRFHMRAMALRKALHLARRYAEFAQSDSDRATTNTSNVMVGISLTYLADYREAATVLERAIRDYPIARRHRDMAWLAIDPPSFASGHLSICLFSRGLIDAAVRVAEQSIEEARQVGQPVALCLAMARAAGLLFSEVGALETADGYIAAMLEQADRYSLDTIRALAVCTRGRVLSLRGEPRAAATALRSGLAQLEGAGYRLFHTIFRGYLAEALAAAGDDDEALAEAEAALHYAEQTDYMRFVPELLRIRGSLTTLRQPDDPAAESMFQRAIELAHQQDALYWELRAGLSLAERWRMQGQFGKAQALLAPIYQRFTEGFAAPVLVRANAFLRGEAPG
jgi:non-specific serine/threonine protein kinase